MNNHGWQVQEPIHRLEVAQQTTATLLTLSKLKFDGPITERGKDWKVPMPILCVDNQGLDICNTAQLAVFEEYV